MVTKSVCENEEIKKTYGGCTAKIIDEKNEIGELTFANTGETKVDEGKIQTLLAGTDEGYKIVADAPAKKTKKK